MTTSPQEEAIQLFAEVLRDLTSPRRDLTLVLRRCQHACQLLNWNDQRAWFQRELEGYPAGSTIPPYRKVRGVLAWRIPGELHVAVELTVAEMYRGRRSGREEESTTLDIWSGIDWLIRASQTGYTERTGETKELSHVGTDPAAADGRRCEMGRPKKVRERLPPIWRLSDEQWAMIEPILAEHDPPARKGPGRVDQRAVFDAVIFRLRTGCQWNWLPSEYPDDSTVHRHLQRWVERGVLDRVWATAQEACEDLGGCDWEWQAADGWLGKARLGGTSWAPTPLIGPRTA